MSGCYFCANNEDTFFSQCVPLCSSNIHVSARHAGGGAWAQSVLPEGLLQYNNNIEPDQASFHWMHVRKTSWNSNLLRGSAKACRKPSLWTLLHKFTDFDNNCLTTSQHDREINTLTHPSSVNLLYHNPFSVDKGHLHRYKLWSCSRPSPVSVSPCLHASFFTSHILHNGP